MREQESKRRSNIMKENLIRIGCVLLGVLLTVCTMHIGELIEGKSNSEAIIVEEVSVTEMNEEVAVAENVKLYSDYEAEAEEKMKELHQKEEERKASEEAVSVEVEAEQVTVSANSIEAAPVKWIKDYPMVNSTMTLEEKMTERSSYEETLAVNAFDKKVIENSTIDFSDVKITILGDSITTAANLSDDEKAKYAYPVILQEILGCKEIVNLGIGGSAVSRAGSYAMVERFSDIPKDTDILIVFGGSNDCLFENKWEFGFVEYDKRMTKGTFCGDLDEMLGGIKYSYREHNEENYVKFIYINPPSTILNDGVYAMDPGNMMHQSSFAEAINVIAPTYGFEVIDLYNNNILNSHDLEVNQQFVPDGIHPNPEGYRILAEHIASQIIQRIEQ